MTCKFVKHSIVFECIWANSRATIDTIFFRKSITDLLSKKTKWNHIKWSVKIIKVATLVVNIA